VRVSILVIGTAAWTAGCAASAWTPRAEEFPDALLPEAAAGAPAASPAGSATTDPAIPLFAAPPFAFEKARGQDLPPVDVTAPPTSEEDPVGENGQPEWTTRRRFARSRVYVLPPWQVESELWSRTKMNSGEGPDRVFQGEVEVGLPYRFQLDLYQNLEGEPGARVHDKGPQVEGRWAFADWGKIPWNPALYGEYMWNRLGAGKYEVKLLLGNAVGPRWHAAANLLLEQETSGARETELGMTAATSYTVVDRKLAIGAEFTASRLSESGARARGTWELAVGPSIQWRFHPHAHLDIVPMFGLNRRSTGIDLFIVLGWDFGGGDEGRPVPTSTKSR
jgi:hypothetical protein